MFETTLSREYALVAVAFDLSDDDVRELVTGSVRHAFMTDAHDDPFASTAMRVKRRVMRGAANWRGFPGGSGTARGGGSWLTSRLMRRIRQVGRTLSTSLSRSNSPVPSPSAEIRYADDDDDDDALSNTREPRLDFWRRLSSAAASRRRRAGCASNFKESYM